MMLNKKEYVLLNTEQEYTLLCWIKRNKTICRWHDNLNGENTKESKKAYKIILLCKCFRVQDFINFITIY